MSDFVRNLPAKGGVVDIVYSPMDDEEDGKGWYLHRYWLAERRDGTSKRFATKEEAYAAYRGGRVRYGNF